MVELIGIFKLCWTELNQFIFTFYHDWVDWFGMSRLQVCLHLHMCIHLHLGNGWTLSAEMWCVVRSINYAFYATTSTWYLHVRKCKCTLFLSTSAHFRLFIAQKLSYWYSRLTQKASYPQSGFLGCFLLVCVARQKLVVFFIYGPVFCSTFSQKVLNIS